MDLPAVPPSPRSPSPRARQLLFSFQVVETVLFWVGSTFLVVGSLVAALLCQHLPTDLLLSLGSTTTVKGRVLSERIDPYNRIHFVHPTIFTFSYKVDGAVYESSSRTVDRALIARLRATREAPIQVSSLRPAHARIEGTSSGAYGPLAALIFILPVTGLSFLTVVLLRRRGRISAFTAGEATRGALIYRGVNDRVRINGRHPELLRWQFVVAGVPYQGSISSMNPQDLTRIVAQGHVNVLYDRRNPANNVPYVD